jgi:hypothetical protein
MLNVTANSFMQDIEKLCRTKNMEYIEAIIHWCDQNKLEVEFAASMIKKDLVMRSKVQVEAENLNVLKKPAKLPI